MGCSMYPSADKVHPKCCNSLRTVKTLLSIVNEHFSGAFFCSNCIIVSHFFDAGVVPSGVVQFPNHVMEFLQLAPCKLIARVFLSNSFIFSSSSFFCFKVATFLYKYPPHQET